MLKRYLNSVLKLSMQNVIFRHQNRRWFGITHGKRLLISVGVLPMLVLQSGTVHAEEKSQTTKADLSQSTLIRNASTVTVDAATTLVTQIVGALVDVEHGFGKSVDYLVSLMELNVQVLGNEHAEDSVWDSILQARARVNQYKRARDELEILLVVAEKMLTAAAEAAYLSGAKYASIAANERLLSAKTQMEILRQDSKKAEEKLTKAQINVIEETSKYSENEKNKKEKYEQDYPQQTETPTVTDILDTFIMIDETDD